MVQKEKLKKTIAEELDEIIEMKKNETKAWKKIADLLVNKNENLIKKTK